MFLPLSVLANRDAPRSGARGAADVAALAPPLPADAEEIAETDAGMKRRLSREKKIPEKRFFVARFFWTAKWDDSKEVR